MPEASRAVHDCLGTVGAAHRPAPVVTINYTGLVRDGFIDLPGDTEHCALTTRGTRTKRIAFIALWGAFYHH